MERKILTLTIKYLFLILMIFFKTYAFGQKSSELKKEREKIKGEIVLIESLIDETKAKKKESTTELKIINRKIELTNAYIINIEAEIFRLEKEINDNTVLIESLEADLNNIKKEYARLIYNAYKNRKGENFLLYILSSESFNQAYKRIKYMQLYSAYKKRQINLIKAFEKVIKRKIEELAINKINREMIIKERERELLNVIKEKQKSQDIINSLKKREKELLAEVELKKGIALKLEREIERMIAEERRKLNAKSIYETLTPDEKLLSSNFEKNKGKLPWPTNKGIITGRFGIQQHPVLKNVKIRNDGIFISTVENEQARAIFDGVVSKVFSLPGSNFAVIIKHGNYYTLYHNLDEVFVKEGEKVQTKQRIGRIFTDRDKNETILQFQVWKEMEKSDPEAWLSR
jgi:septal ring factor EnvC (AmiA/AmiB activator)